MNYTKNYPQAGADYSLLPGSDTGKAEVVSPEELLAGIPANDGKVVFNSGCYDLTDSLYLEDNDTVYDFNGCTVVSSSGAEIILKGSRSSLLRVNSFIPVILEESASQSALMYSHICEEVRLYASDLILRNNVFDAHMEVYSENARIERNSFVDCAVNIFDSISCLLAFNTMVMSPVSISYGYNDTIIGNEFSESGEFSLSAKECDYLSLVDNTTDSVIRLASCQVVLSDGNGRSPETENCEKVYGGDIPGACREYGADETRLPQPFPMRFESILRKKSVTEADPATGKIYDIPISDYITGRTADCSFILIPPGAYSLPKGNKGHIEIGNISDLLISGCGALIECEDYTTTAVFISNSNRITLKGLYFDYALVANTQGKVIYAGEDFVVWTPDEGYPDKLCDEAFYPAQGAAEGYRGSSDRPFRDLNIKEKKQTEYGTYVRFISPHNLRKGDKLIFRGNFAHVNYFEECSEITYEDVTLFGGSGFGVMEHGGDGGTILRRLCFTPGPPPVPGAPERLISVCDATHSTNMRKGIRVYDCFFEKMTDDATNVNGSYGDVFAVEKTPQGVKMTYGCGSSNYSSMNADFRAGDGVMVYTQKGKFIAKTQAISATFIEFNKKCVYIADYFTPEAETVVENTSANGRGFEFDNCLFRNNRSRGLLIKAMDGAIRHCTVTDTGMSGILIKPEISDNWGECGFSENVTVEYNLLKENGYFTGSELHSPINISGDSEPTSDPDYHNHKNITVRNNLIESRYTKYAINANMVEGLIIENNRILPRKERYEEFAEQIINPLASINDDNVPAIHVSGSSKVVIRDNIIPPSSVKIADTD